MKKKIEWWIVQGDGKARYHMNTREAARNEKKWYDDNIFHEHLGDVIYPLKIVRKEWLLVDEKVVR